MDFLKFFRDLCGINVTVMRKKSDYKKRPAFASPFYGRQCIENASLLCGRMFNTSANRNLLFNLALKYDIS